MLHYILFLTGGLFKVFYSKETIDWLVWVDNIKITP